MRPAKIYTAPILSLLLFLASSAIALDPNGTAAYSDLGKQLYLGTLYLETPLEDAGEVLSSSQKKRMEIRFLDTVSKRSWSRTWTQSMAINSSRDSMVSAADDLSEALGAFQSNLEYGDQVVIDYDPLYGTSVAVNGVQLVKDRSTALFNLFLSTWIGPVPPNSQFKNAILGKSASQDDYTTFLSVSPPPERVETVKTWNTKLKEEQERALAEAKAAEEQKQAEEEAMRLAEEAAEKQAKEEELAEENRLALIEEEKRKAQEAAREAAEEAAKKEAERLAAIAAGTEAQEEEVDEDDVDLSVEAILAQQDYTTQVIRKIYTSVSYPRSAIKRQQQGSVRAIVTIDRGGAIINVSMSEESEFDSLNKAAVKAINKAAPFPPIPEAVREETIDMTVPIAFKLQ